MSATPVASGFLGHRSAPREGGSRTLGRRVLAISILVAIAATANHSLHAQNRDFIWKASRGQSVVYLVGSVHLLSKDYYPLSPALDKAFKECDLLVEELRPRPDGAGRVADDDPDEGHAALRADARQGRLAGDVRAGQRAREVARPARSNR